MYYIIPQVSRIQLGEMAKKNWTALSIKYFWMRPARNPLFRLSVCLTVCPAHFWRSSPLNTTACLEMETNPPCMLNRSQVKKKERKPHSSQCWLPPSCAFAYNRCKNFSPSPRTLTYSYAYGPRIVVNYDLILIGSWLLHACYRSVIIF